MSSPTVICNMALGHLGVGKEIAALTTENSQEARSCRRFYEMARDSVLEAYPWPFATKRVTLGLIEADPNDEWGYSYTYPSDCVAMRRILSGIRDDSVDTRTPYKIEKNGTAKVIYTDKEDAILEYTYRNTATEEYSAQFMLCLSLRIAAYIAPSITAGDPFKVGERALKLYHYELGVARMNAGNEESPDPTQPEAESIRARE